LNLFLIFNQKYCDASLLNKLGYYIGYEVFVCASAECNWELQ